MDEPKSKTQKKREADELQDLGVKLIPLKPSQLEQLLLPPPLFLAICDAKAIKSHGALRRQKQLIGKLMRKADYESIQEAYQSFMEEENAQTAHFHELERWRDQLINDGQEALTRFVSQFGVSEIQPLRQLIKKAIDEKNTGKPAGAARALFRFIRTL